MATHTANTQYGDLERTEMHPYIPSSASKVLDVGCHTGAFGRSLKRLGIASVWGVEANSVSAAVAASHLDTVLVGYFADVAIPDAFFDAVIFNDVLEHMVDPQQALRIAVQKLAPGGVVVASIPNLRHIDNLVHILKDKDFRYEMYGIRDATHLRFYTEKSIYALFEQSGFDVVSLEGINEDWWIPSIMRRAAFRLFPNYLRDTRFMQFAVVARPTATNA